ncbi:MAG: MerR family transcriptional regulator [Acidimicrobiaceae bacterium]|nr:MerR family transcriptional regulator [Acidimicrobiaceae bacterium]
MDDELLEIGQFSAASGLTVAALRHYDEVGVLKPAEVDPRTSYRRYRREQLVEAQIICQLRSVDLPVDEVRSVLQANDVDSVRDVLIRHQGRLAERAHSLERMIETSHTYLDRGLPPRPAAEPRPVQIMLAVRDRGRLVDFYRTVFGWDFNEEISSFTLGAYHTSSFFIITIENWNGGNPACFGLLVEDVDAVHQRAIQAGATEISQPADYAWKPRSSVVDDMSGNRIQLSQT